MIDSASSRASLTSGLLSDLSARLARIQSRAEVVAARLAAAAVIAIAAAILYDVFVTQLLRGMAPGVYEGTGLLMIFVVFLPWADIQRQREHICIDAIVARLPRRTRAVVQVIALLIWAMGLAVMGYQSAGIAWKSWATGDISTGLLPLPVWPSRGALMVGVGLLCLRLIVQLGEALREFSGSRGSIKQSAGG